MLNFWANYVLAVMSNAIYVTTYITKLITNGNISDNVMKLTLLAKL